MSDSHQTILTCVSCGNTFTGPAHGKKFKCAGCQDILTSLDDTGLNRGKVLCGNCWSGIELRDELCKASEKLFGGPGGEADGKLLQANKDLEARMLELQTRLVISEESLLGAQRERDAAIELRRALDVKLSELKTELDLARETEQAALDERNGATGMCVELEEKLAALQEPLRAAREAAVKERDSSNARRVLEERASVLEAELMVACKAGRAAAAERDAFCKQLAELSANQCELQGELASAREAQVATFKEREAAARTSRELEARIVELQAEFAAAAAARETEAQHEQVELRREIEQLKAAAASALEPLGRECNRNMGDLEVESVGLLEACRRSREEATLRIERIALLTTDLKEHLNAVRRQVVTRVASVLGSPPAESGLASAVSGPALPISGESATPRRTPSNAS